MGGCDSGMRMAWNIEAFHSGSIFDCEAHVPWPTLFFLCHTVVYMQYIHIFIVALSKLYDVPYTVVSIWMACLPLNVSIANFAHWSTLLCSCVLVCAVLYIVHMMVRCHFIPYGFQYHQKHPSFWGTVNWCVRVCVCVLYYSTKWKAFKCCWVLFGVDQCCVASNENTISRDADLFDCTTRTFIDTVNRTFFEHLKEEQPKKGCKNDGNRNHLIYTRLQLK